MGRYSVFASEATLAVLCGRLDSIIPIEIHVRGSDRPHQGKVDLSLRLYYMALARRRGASHQVSSGWIELLRSFHLVSEFSSRRVGKGATSG